MLHRRNTTGPMLNETANRHRLAAALVVASLALVAPLTATAASEDADTTSNSILILPFDMVDTSLQGEMNHGPLKSDIERLDRTEQIVRRDIAAQPDFDIVPIDDVRQRIADAQNTYRYLYECNGCDVDIGKAAGADLVMTGWVQKVSNLILNINATIRRVDTGQEIGGASVDMRNNTDDSWRSAGLYLVEHALMSNYHAHQPMDGSEGDDDGAKPHRVPIRHYPG